MCRRLAAQDVFSIKAPLRSVSVDLPPSVQRCSFGELATSIDWISTLSGVDIVIHAAARVHVMKEHEVDSLAEYRRINVEGSLSLARQAVAAGVRRFIFISSVKVCGEFSQPGQPLRADDTPAPVDAYGISKYEAELALYQLAADTGLELVVIRPVLVYGPGVKANFHSMMRWVYHGVPLPFGSVDNRRSLIFLDNLIDLIATCIDHPKAVNQTFLASDGDDVSISHLLRSLGQALGRPARLVAIPNGLLRLGGRLLSRSDMTQRLLGSLQVDISKNKQMLEWTPPFTLEQGLIVTAQHFLETHRS